MGAYYCAAGDHYRASDEHGYEDWKGEGVCEDCFLDLTRCETCDGDGCEWCLGEGGIVPEKLKAIRRIHENSSVSSLFV